MVTSPSTLITVTLSGGGIFNNESLSITNSTVSGNSAYQVGGGIFNLVGTLTINNSTISGNSADESGGIENLNTLTITDSTVSGNTADDGGGINNRGNSTTTITNSTISGNSVNNDGGGINNFGTLTIINSTISGNSADEGGGINNKLDTTTSLVSTIVADNTADNGTPDIFNNGNSTTVTASNSLIENGTITQDLGNNITGQDPLLDPQGLQDNGGPTQTIALLPGSPAINAGSNPLGLTTDQRGKPRTLGDSTDIGADEAPFVIVDTLTDVVDATDGKTSLREALVSAVNGDTITFANSLSGGTITLGGSRLAITKSLTIHGDINNDGVGDITIDGDGRSRVLIINDGYSRSNRNVFLHGLTVTGGSVLTDGGGILNHESLSITNSTISGNSAGYYGGGIDNRRILTINNSTVSGNSADNGGGIANYSGTSTINNSTISGNSANEGGGIANKLSSTTSLVSTIVADNTAETGTPDIYNDGSSSTVTASNSLIENGTITQDLGKNITGQDPLLDPQGLQDNGGPTQTIALQENSPAINAGSNPLGLTTDQRGEARTLGGATDIGAYEVELSFDEYGTLDNLNHEWQTVTLNESYINPVVIVSDPTFNGSDPAVVRLRNVDSNSFELRIQEPTYLNDRHTEESASYLVLEAGDWTLSDGTRISAGTHNTDILTSEGFETINLTGFESTPTVLTQVQTFNGPDWVTTRTQGQSSSRFQTAMQEQESLNNSGHAEETIGWVAIDQGVANSGDILLEGGTTGRNYDEDEGTVSFSEDFDSTPSVIAKLGSYYGRDTANLRLDSITSTGFGVRVQEEKSLDNEIAHTNESISFLALEGDSGFLF